MSAVRRRGADVCPRLDFARDSAFTALQAQLQQAPTQWANRLCLAGLVLALGVLGGLALLDFLTPCPHAVFCAAVAGLPGRRTPPRRADPDADTEPGSMLSAEELAAIERKVREAPPPKLRLVEGSLERQVAYKRETRTLWQQLLDNGVVQAHYGRVTRARLALAGLVRRCRLALQSWRARRMGPARKRCRKELRNLMRKLQA